MECMNVRRYFQKKEIIILYDYSSLKILMQYREYLLSGSVLILVIDQLNAQQCSKHVEECNKLIKKQEFVQ